MTNNLQDRFRKIGEGSIRFVATRGEVLDFILSEVEQAKKDLINQILAEAPEDKEFTLNDDSVFPIWAEGWNECGKQWKSLLTKLIK